MWGERTDTIHGTRPGKDSLNRGGRMFTKDEVVSHVLRLSFKVMVLTAEPAQRRNWV